MLSSRRFKYFPRAIYDYMAEPSGPIVKKPVSRAKSPKPKAVAADKSAPSNAAKGEMAISSPPGEKKDAFEDSIRIPLENWWNFACANFKEFYFRLLKLNLIRVILQFAAMGALLLLLVGIILWTPWVGLENGLLIMLLSVGVLGILGFLAVLWLIQSFENTAYLLTRAQIKRDPFSLPGGLNAVKGKTLRFVLVDVSLRTIILLPAVLILAVPFVVIFNASAAAFAFFPLFMFAYVFYLLYFYVTGVIYQFLTQFWRYGFLIEGLGIIAALRKSVSLLRAHFFEVLVYDAILVVLYFTASIPLMIFTGITYFGLMFLQIAALAVPLVGIILYAVAFLFAALIATFLSTITEVVWRPAHYEFWKQITGREDGK
jgi:hypothetical protein